VGDSTAASLPTPADLAAMSSTPSPMGGLVDSGLSNGSSNGTAFPPPPGAGQSQALPPAPFFQPPPPPVLDQILSTGDSNAINTSDAEITQWLGLYIGLAVLMAMVFVILRPFHPALQARLLFKGIVRRPPALPGKRCRWIWSWLVPVLFTPQAEVIRTAGLDAQMYLTILSVGFCFFFGASAFIYLTLVPLHLSATDAGWLKDFGDNLTFVGNSSSICVGTNGSDGNDTSFIACYFTSPFSSISMRRIPTGSPLLWCHFVVFYIIMGWAFALNMWIFKTYTQLRHAFLGRVMDAAALAESQAELPALSWRALLHNCVEFPTSCCGGAGGEEGADDREGVLEVGTAAAAVALARRLSYAGKRKHPSDGAKKNDQRRNASPEKNDRRSALEDTVYKAMSQSRWGSETSHVSGALSGGSAGAVRSPAGARMDPAPAELSMIREAPNGGAQPPRLQLTGATPSSQQAVRGASTPAYKAARGNHGPHFPVERPSVLRVKMAPTEQIDGKARYAPAELYAVLVTGIPRLEKQRHIMGQRITKPGAPGGSKVQMAALEEDAAAAGVVDPGAVELDMSNGATDIAPRDGAATAMESGAQASSLPDAPMGISEDELVAVVFSELFPDSFRCTVPVHDDSKVMAKLCQWQAAARNLAVAKKQMELSDRRPQARDGGCLCCGGTQVDALEHFEKKVQSCREEIAQLQEEARQAKASSAFVFFKDQMTATTVAQAVLHAEDNRYFRTHPAPGPDDVNWKSLRYTASEVGVRKLIALPFLVLLILFPAGFFTASIINASEAFCGYFQPRGQFEFYCGTPQEPLGSTEIYVLATSQLLPALLLTVWQTVVMPLAFYYLALFQADGVSKSETDRHIGNYFVIWGVLNVFIGGFLGGLTQLYTLALDPANWLDKLGAAMAEAANFFIALVQTQTLISTPMVLMQPHLGVWFWFLAKLLHKRAGGCCLLESDIQKTWQPKSYRYGREIPIHLNIMLLGLAYSIVSPGILPYCVCYFLFFWLVRRFQTLYVFERCYESGGLWWPFVFDKIMLFLNVFGLFMAGIFLTWGSPAQAGILLLTFPPMIHYFKRHCHSRFDSSAAFLPLDMAKVAPLSAMDPVEYQSPALREGNDGWYDESHIVWEGYGMPGDTL